LRIDLFVFNLYIKFLAFWGISDINRGERKEVKMKLIYPNRKNKVEEKEIKILEGKSIQELIKLICFNSDFFSIKNKKFFLIKEGVFINENIDYVIRKNDTIYIVD